MLLKILNFYLMFKLFMGKFESTRERMDRLHGKIRWGLLTILEPCPRGHGGAEGYSKRSVFGQTGTLVFGRENVRNCQFSIFRHHFAGMCPQMPPIQIR